MNNRQIILRNREVRSPLKGRITRKRVAMKITENKNILKESKAVENVYKNTLNKAQINEKKKDNINNGVSNVRKFDLKYESLILDKENKICYENLFVNPLIWPLSSELLTCKERKKLLDNIITRREVIRLHFKDLNNNGNPIWFPDQTIKNEYMHKEYLANINDYMMDCELMHEPLGRNFLENSTHIGPRQRYIFINWIVQSHSQLKMGAETLQLSISIADKFIKAHKATIKVEDLLLIGMMGIFIAAKFEEVWPPSLEEFINEFKLKYTMEFCRELEMKILETLNFKLSFPLPINFIRHYNIVIEGSALSHYLSRYFCELSIQDYEASGYSINMMSSSCVFLAQVICLNIESKFEQVWDKKLQTASGLVLTDFMHLVKNLCIIISKQTAKSNYRAISRKYSSENLMNVYSKSLTSTGFLNILQYFKNEGKQ